MQSISNREFLVTLYCVKVCHGITNGINSELILMNRVVLFSTAKKFQQVCEL
jgi:hypothetical protein